MLKTKQDYQKCLYDFINPIKNYYTPAFAGIKCGSTSVCYGENTALMEGFARILWGLAPYWAGGGKDKDFEKIYLTGIINGTNPEQEEYWGEICDVDQKIVETSALGLGLILAPDKIWEPLNDKQKENLYNWLSQVNYVKNSDNNWNFFPVLVNLGFKTVGMPYDKEKIDYSLDRIDSFYIGNGWYTDGNSNQVDYYIAFAMHFYGLIYAKVMEKEDEVRSKTFKERAMLFAKDFIYWFAKDGSALAFGRSMTYRMAQCCFWSACVYAGIEPYSLGVMKGIISRNLEWWSQKPVFDNGGVLSIGYAYPNLCMSEEYNGFGSPYWALKAFLILALDDDHPFFEAEPLPLPKLDDLHIIKEAKMVIQRVDGHAYAITAGQWVEWTLMHVAEKYSKFVYSSKYAFSIARSYYGLVSAGTDSMLTFVKDNMCFVRRKCVESRINDDGSVWSKWSPYDGVMVETLIIPAKTGHIRKHKVVCKEDCIAYDCSFAMPEPNDKIYGNGETETIWCAPNTNLMNPWTELQMIKYNLISGENTIETEIVY